MKRIILSAIAMIVVIVCAYHLAAVNGVSDPAVAAAFAAAFAAFVAVLAANFAGVGATSDGYICVVSVFAVFAAVAFAVGSTGWAIASTLAGIVLVFALRHLALWLNAEDLKESRTSAAREHLESEITALERRSR